MNNDPMKVSRVEFYHALSLVWLFISFAFMVRLSGSRSWDVGLYFLVSFLMALMYSVTWFRLYRRCRAGQRTAA